MVGQKANVASSPGMILLIWGPLLALLLRLFAWQVLSPEETEKARRYILRRITLYPLRGMLYDREGNLLAGNAIAYDLIVIPALLREAQAHELAPYLPNLVSLLPEKHAKNPWDEQVIATRLTTHQLAFYLPHITLLSGVEIRKRYIRWYPVRCCAHLLGYLSKVTREDIARDPFYDYADFIGVAGVEKLLEKQLRGEKGYRYVLVDPQGTAREAYLAGKLDKKPQPGKSFQLSVWLPLQQYAESLLIGKRGAIVMLEIGTGEILVMASAPTFSLDSLQGPTRGNYYRQILTRAGFPLLNRAIAATYPPGSTIKPLHAYVFVSMGGIRVHTGWGCPGAWQVGNLSVGCHLHPYLHGIVDAIAYSCNSFFSMAFIRSLAKNPRLQLMTWHHWLHTFGLGQPTNSGFPGEQTGFVPDTAYYDKKYHRQWNAYTIVSLAIGQAELLVTPLQLAYMTALIASDGRTHPPTILHTEHRYRRPPPRIHVDSHLMAYVRKGMEAVIQYGTAWWLKIPGLCWAGKTGTAENPHGADHSLFIGYAPCQYPEVAIAVVIEHGGFGSQIAGPIASLLIARAFLNEFPPILKQREQYVRNYRIDYQTKKPIHAH